MKLWLHKVGEKYGDAQLVLNSKAIPELELGDLVEIYDQEDEAGRLLLQFTHRFDDFQKDRVSVEQSLASQFRLKNYSDVVVAVVAKEKVALDLLELTCKEQYISRSDMWRVRRELLLTCAHVNQNRVVSRVRCYLNEMWALGERVACGYVNEETRIVFRTTSSMMYIFIQMSGEMWEFDTQGDLYLEKCVNGFLPEVFRGWAQAKCSHYVNFVIFSRWYYRAEDLPDALKATCLKDYRGGYYQDFYRLLVQNEHYEDWAPVLRKLKLAFHQFSTSIKKFHTDFYHVAANQLGLENSTAADGNFLEALNMSLNVYAKHFVDRKLERTGQQIVLITPGGGVFNVDRDFATITKQRVIDLGVSIDIVCLGEQPLHAVPLFIYNNKSRAEKPELEPAIQDYFLPHWMNYNFYSPPGYRRTCCTFRPRMKMPEALLARPPAKIQLEVGESDPFSYPDFDAYDRQVFRPLLTDMASGKESSRGGLVRQSSDPSKLSQIGGSRGSSEPDGEISSSGASYSTGKEFRVGSADNSSNAFAESPDATRHKDHRREGSERPKGKRPLINPFIPSEISVRITANRRRWIHVFPTNRSGLAKQAHVLVAGSSLTYALQEQMDQQKSMAQSAATQASSHTANRLSSSKSTQRSSTPADQIPVGPGAGPVMGTGPQGKTLVWAWGPTGEEQWNPDVEIGVDWKSLVQPALLPTTTDFFPDSRSLKINYVFNEHTVLLDDQGTRFSWSGDGNSERDYRFDIFEELVNQRLQRGFQIIILPKSMLHSAVWNSCGPSRLAAEKECFLSINRIYHRISLVGQCIFVTQFTPRHLQNVRPISYQYQFQVPDNESYEFSRTLFELERLEKVNWSVLDNYIVTQGQSDAYRLHPSMKFWDIRFALVSSAHPGTKKIISELGNTDFRCDIYADPQAEGQNSLKLLENFLKFVESLNKLKRPPSVTRLLPTNKDSKGDIDSGIKVSVLLAEISKADSFTFLQSEFLPSRSFVSAELVYWLMGKLSDIETVSAAVRFADGLLKSGHIEHVPGTLKQFKFGFYIYAMTEKDLSDDNLRSGSKLSVSFPWVECDLLPGTEIPQRLNVLEDYELDSGRKPGRREYARLKYSSGYSPSCAFHMELQWIVGSGPTVAELIHNVWNRRAAQCFLQIIPVPLDPFVLPTDPSSDPLRQPVHVALPEEPLRKLDHSSRTHLRVTILERFGFICLPDAVQLPDQSSSSQYIHYSGGMFVLLPDDGFLWSWNFMLSHKYRTPTTADEAFQDKLLQDFRRFCSNQDDRLTTVVNQILSEQQKQN